VPLNVNTIFKRNLIVKYKEGNLKVQMRYFIKLAYNGTLYQWLAIPTECGVTRNTEQGCFLPCSEISVGAGRTDTGVHAKQMYAHLIFF
jgi:tRNA pseudouridine38-40 synthase